MLRPLSNPCLQRSRSEPLTSGPACRHDENGDFFPASLGVKTQEAGESRNSWISPCLCNPPAFQKQRPHSIKLHKAACASRPQSVFWPPKTHRTQNPSMATLGELNHPQLLHNWTPLGSVSECRSYSFDGEPV